MAIEEECAMGHGVCQRCGTCHHCWAMPTASCETLALYVAAMGVDDEATITVQEEVERKQKKEEQRMGKHFGHNNIDNPNVIDYTRVYTWDDLDHDKGTLVTKVGRHEVEYDVRNKGYVIKIKSKSWGNGTGYGGQRKSCKHPGSTEVVNVDGVSFRCGKGWDLAPGKVDLIIDLANTQSASQFVMSSDKKWQELNAFVAVNEAIKLDWKDQTTPPVGLRFWEELWRRLPKPSKIVICCMGGHGRTGTCLAALLIASRAVKDAKAAIKLVRTQHCDEAIETKGQEKYLELLAERVAEVDAAATAAEEVTVDEAVTKH